MNIETIASGYAAHATQSVEGTEPLANDLAEQAFTRAAGARLIEGNAVRLLLDAGQNYPAWLDSIANARHTVHFENYIICDDAVGSRLADALVAKARAGVRVRLLYDWMGTFGKASRAYWTRLAAAGVEVRSFNPPRLDSPLGWLSRDHRKSLIVDGEVGFVTGLCVGSIWEGDAARGIEPWRDTGVEVRGPAVVEIEAAFAQVWAMCGAPLQEPAPRMPPAAGDVALRVVASIPNSAGILRLDQVTAALARERLWLTDPYFAGTPAFVQSLRAAARGGVDVRLLVPDATDIPLLQPLSRAGYRTLLEAGVRVFEWNGSMLHAKTAVADGYIARIGSTNLNLASWLGNCELDVVIQDEPFATVMEQQYLADLENATEVVLDARLRLSAHAPRRAAMPSGAGSAGRAASGALRIGNAVGAAFTNRRVLEPVEARIMTTTGLVLLAIALVGAVFPWLLVVPLVVAMVWLALSLLVRGSRIGRRREAVSVLSEPAPTPPATPASIPSPKDCAATPASSPRPSEP